MTKTAVENDLLCEGCDGPETDGDPMVECLNGGAFHLMCHTGACHSRACHEYLGTGDDIWLEDR